MRLILVAGLLMLLGCGGNGSSVSGVEPSRLAEPDKACVVECNSTARAALRAESRRHVEAVQGCLEDPACLEDEAALHVENVHAIQEARKACKVGCRPAK